MEVTTDPDNDPHQTTSWEDKKEERRKQQNEQNGDRSIHPMWIDRSKFYSTTQNNSYKIQHK